jgi:hypothetical protein
MMTNFDRTALYNFPSHKDGSRAIFRSQNFTVEQAFGTPGEQVHFASRDETILLIPEGKGTIRGASTEAVVERRGIAVLSPGAFEFLFETAQRIFILTTGRIAFEDREPINAASYGALDTRVAPVNEPFLRVSGGDEIRIFAISDIPFPPTNPRLKFIQSATMSINWVEYNEPRDRSALSPHAHPDLEQGSLAINGDFIHHLRTPWGKNADLWRDDAHLNAKPSSLLVVAPDIIHTTEGVGSGHHLLVDVFAPPRRDFIEKGWIANAADYRDPMPG